MYCLLVSSYFNFFHLQISFANSLDLDKFWQNIGHDVDPNCLTLWWCSWRVNHFIIYKVMKYRKIFIKYNAYFKKAVFHSHENIKSYISQQWKYKLYFTSEFWCPLFSPFPWLPWAHFRISNACNFHIRGQKHKMWVFILLVRSQGKFW